METVYLNRFDLGMVNDPRDPSTGAYRVITNFDVLTNKYKATPYRQSEDGDSSSTTSQKQNFGIGLWTPTSAYRMFSLGVVSGTAKAEILMKDVTTGAANDLDDATWATPAANQSSTGTTNFELFIYYKQTGKFYGARSNTNIWAFTPDGSTAFDDTSHALAYTNIAQGLVHSKDDILYIPYDNKIAKNNNGSWTDAALTLPSHLYITSIAENGNYLAIVAAPLSGLGNSKCYLWDRDASLTTISESYDIGNETVKIAEEVDGILITISLAGGNSSRLNERVVIRALSGGQFEKLFEFVGTTSTQLLIAKQKINNRLYFMMSIVLNGTRREGVWSIGRQSIGSPFGLVHERTPNNDTALTSGILKNFFFVGDYLFQSYVSNGSYALSKTDDQANYATSTIETTINPGMNKEHRKLKKQLTFAYLLYEALPAGTQAVLKVRIDGKNKAGTALAYDIIFTETTDGQVKTPRFVKTTSGDEFTNGTDIEFKIDSTGAEIAGLVYGYEPFLNE